MSLTRPTSLPAACEIPAKNAGHRAFVGIYPPLPEHGILEWRIKRFELPNALMNESVYDGDLVDLQFVRVGKLEEVEDALRSWGIASSLFDPPWKCDWPL